MAAPIVYTDYDSEAENIARRQKYAEALRDQASQALPTGQMVGNRVVPISWTQGLAQVLKGYAGHKMSEKASADRTALAGKRNAALAEVLGAMPKARNVALPTDQEGTGSFDMSGTAGPQQKLEAPTMQENAAWLGKAAGLGGNAPALATTMLGMQQKADENEANRQSRTMDRIMQLESAAANLAASREERAARAREANELRRELAAQADARARELAASQDTLRRDLAAQTAALRQEPAPTVTEIVKDGKRVKVDARTGRVIGDAAPTAAMEKVATAKKKMLTELTEAERELEKATADGGLIDKSTGSGIGAGIDMAAGLIGKATPGAIAVGQMKPIFDLVLKMVPRFEGPQSDKDTASYKEAAGQLANPAVPNPIKKAAGKEILRLMKARKGQFVSKDFEAIEAEAGGASGGVIDFNSLQ